MNKDQLQHKCYLGDAVYVGYDGYHIWLYTDNGIQVTDKIALEPTVLGNFHAWLDALPPKLQKEA